MDMYFVNQLNGEMLEEAYAKVLDGYVNGGYNDKGKDVILTDNFPMGLQIKSSFHYAKDHLKLCIKFNKFIPIAIGEPGTKFEIIESITKFGAWVEKGLHRRDDFLIGCQKLRRKLVSS